MTKVTKKVDEMVNAGSKPVVSRNGSMIISSPLVASDDELELTLDDSELELELALVIETLSSVCFLAALIVHLCFPRICLAI